MIPWRYHREFHRDRSGMPSACVAGYWWWICRAWLCAMGIVTNLPGLAAHPGRTVRSPEEGWPALAALAVNTVRCRPPAAFLQRSCTGQMLRIAGEESTG